MFPLAVNLEERKALILGAGKVAARKARQLLEAGAVVDVIAETVMVEMPLGIRSLRIRSFLEGDLEGYWLVVSAIGNTSVNDVIVAEASHRKIWLNVVDDAERSSFFFTALHRDGDVVISVSTQGASPSLAQVLRDRIVDSLPKNVGRVAQQLRQERQLFFSEGRSTESVDWHPRAQALLDEL